MASFNVWFGVEAHSFELFEKTWIWFRAVEPKLLNDVVNVHTEWELTSHYLQIKGRYTYNTQFINAIDQSRRDLKGTDWHHVAASTDFPKIKTLTGSKFYKNRYKKNLEVRLEQEKAKLLQQLGNSYKDNAYEVVVEGLNALNTRSSYYLARHIREHNWQFGLEHEIYEQCMRETNRRLLESLQEARKVLAQKQKEIEDQICANKLSIEKGRKESVLRIIGQHQDIPPEIYPIFEANIRVR